MTQHDTASNHLIETDFKDDAYQRYYAYSQVHDDHRSLFRAQMEPLYLPPYEEPWRLSAGRSGKPRQNWFPADRD